MDANKDKSFVVSRFDEFDALDRKHEAMRKQLKRKFFKEVAIAVSCALALATICILILQAI